MTIGLKKLLRIALGVAIVLLAQLAVPILFEWKIDLRFWIVVLGVTITLLVTNFQEPSKLAINAFILILCLGSSIALIKPVQYGLDEEAHLANAIGLSDSFLFKYSNETLEDYESVFLHDGIRNQENFRGDDYWYSVEHKKSNIKGTPNAFDNPAFIPGSLGWNIGRLLSNKVYISYYLGRIFHVLAFASLVYAAIKLSKAYQEMIYLMGTLPSTMYIVSNYHYDYLYYGASLLIIALLTNILSGKILVTKKVSLLYQAFVTLFIFSKFPLVLAGSLISVLPGKYYDSKKTRWFSLGVFSLNFLFALLYSGIIPMFSSANPVTGSSPGLLYFAKHPLPIIRTMLSMPAVIVENYMIRPLHYVSHQSDTLIAITTLLVFSLLTIIVMQTSFKLSKNFIIWTLLTLLGITFLIIYAITGDPRVYSPGNILVGGVQGRYYYFMILMAPILLGHFIQRAFKPQKFSLQQSNTFLMFLQSSMVYLNIFTISVGLYTQI
ncbi:DUF2142 domain-containing protein [Streptococcus acidominimus]|uniref:YjbE family integral membrane protein n=1 Tax=Streptococcus acidominimus TaxID=1326 RepID=A0A1Q8EE25_STRAI|nr:DUF2142 domain-containing protein [Streptococcus acidominimus]OLF50052.1 hypothetical protein BU200_03995 [Streptococcus acidominimus]SUN08056.1 YjbE family integral membrane protein [Streptococcus acidominimus]